MSLTVDLHISDVLEPQSHDIPNEPQFKQWLENAYQTVCDSTEPAEVSLKIVDEQEMTQLNEQYRDKTGGTNVLSFPVDLPDEVAAEISPRPLGDIVICHPIVCNESHQQQKTVDDHYAHMVTHSLLHLVGFDHQDDQQASEMESLEKTVLAKIGIADPY